MGAEGWGNVSELERGSSEREFKKYLLKCVLVKKFRTPGKQKYGLFQRVFLPYFVFSLCLYFHTNIERQAVLYITRHVPMR